MLVEFRLTLVEFRGSHTAAATTPYSHCTSPTPEDTGPTQARGCSVLHQDCPDEDLRRISAWRNSDQNQNLLHNDIETIRIAQHVSARMIKLSEKVVMSTVVAKIIEECPVKLNPNNVLSLVRFVSFLGGKEYVDELCTWHARNVDPTKLTVSHTLFEQIGKNFREGQQLVGLNIAILAFCKDKVMPQQNPLPDISIFVTPAEVKTFAENVDTVNGLQQFMQQVRSEIEKFLLPQSHRNQLRDYQYIGEQMALRLCMGKPPMPNFPFPKKGPQETSILERLPDVRVFLYKHIAKTMPTSGE